MNNLETTSDGGTRAGRFEIVSELCIGDDNSVSEEQLECEQRLGEISIKGEELEQIADFDRKQVFPSFTDPNIDEFGKAVKLKFKTGKITFTLDDSVSIPIKTAVRNFFKRCDSSLPTDIKTITLNGCRLFEGNLLIPDEDGDGEYTTTFALLKTDEAKPDFFKKPQSFFLGYYAGSIPDGNFRVNDNCLSSYETSKEKTPKVCSHLSGKMTRQ